MERPRILVAEDQAPIALELEESLLSLGFEAVAVVQTGEDAFAKAIELHPDLILMDVMLKGTMDGIEAAIAIHRQEAIPVVYLTAHSSPEIIGRAKQTHPYGYLLKPFDRHELRTTLELAFHKHQTEQTLHGEMRRELQQVIDRLEFSLRVGQMCTWEINLHTGAVMRFGDRHLLANITPGTRINSYHELLEYVHPDDRHRVLNEVRRAIDEHREFEIELRMLWPDQSVHWITGRGQVQYSGDGNPFRIVAVHTDITERKNAELAHLERERSFELLFSKNPLPMFVYDLETLGFLEVNETAIRVYGYSRMEFLQMRITDIRPEEDIPRLLHDVQQDRPTLQFSGIWRHRLASGNIIEVEIVSHTLNYHGRRAALVVAQDVTERQRAFSEIQRLNNELNQLVADRTEQLTLSNQELEGFSYTISHDLRAPLRAITGFASTLREEAADRLDRSDERYLELISKNAHEMGKLIDDLLSFTRLNKKAIRKNSIDMQGLIRSVVNQERKEYPQRQITIRIDTLPEASGDLLLLRQVFSNLVSNALKFTTGRPQTLIHIGSFPENGGTVYFIRDNGAGFQMDYVGKLFKVFHRLHTVDEFPGTGIGLAIVKRIVERHGGRVWAEGKKNEGASVFVFLPYTGNANPPEGTPPFILP